MMPGRYGMRRILVIGCPGAGKSRFARELSEVLAGVPLYHLDNIRHLPDRTTIPREAFDERLRAIMATESWIFDGNYQRTLAWRLREADTVFLFDLPVEVCLAGATERLNRKRDDMPWTEEELSPEFRERILNFPKTCLPEITRLLDAFPGDVVRFASRKEAEDYIAELREKQVNL